MNKKSRFNMLEVEPGKSEESVKKVKSNKPARQEEIKREKDFKVVINNEDFKRNLQKHKLKLKKKEIEKEKVKIKQDVEALKKAAFLKIYIGLAIIAYGVAPLVLGYFVVGFTDVNIKRQLVIIGIGFVVQVFLGKKGKNK